MSMWAVVLVVGLLTFAIRYSFIGLFGRIAVPESLERALRYIAPAVLAALVLPAVIAPGGTFDPWNIFVPAAIGGGLAAWTTRSIGAAILVGMPILWILQAAV